MLQSWSWPYFDLFTILYPELTAEGRASLVFVYVQSSAVSENSETVSLIAAAHTRVLGRLFCVLFVPGCGC